MYFSLKSFEFVLNNTFYHFYFIFILGQQQRLNIQLNNQQPWIQEVDYGEIIENKGTYSSDFLVYFLTHIIMVAYFDEI